MVSWPSRWGSSSSSHSDASDAFGRSSSSRHVATSRARYTSVATHSPSQPYAAMHALTTLSIAGTGRSLLLSGRRGGAQSLWRQAQGNKKFGPKKITMFSTLRYSLWAQTVGIVQRQRWLRLSPDCPILHSLSLSEATLYVERFF